MDLFWRMVYAVGFTPWEGADAPPLQKLVETGLPAGRALDLGCGTGAHSVYLARHGWEVAGVDVVPRALRTARRRASAVGTSVAFIRGDVTQLEDLPLAGPYDLVLDMGCFHGLSTAARRTCAAQIHWLTTPSSDLLVDAVSPRRGIGPRGIDEQELRSYFPGWEILSVDTQPPMSAGPFRGAQFSWYHLHRNQ